MIKALRSHNGCNVNVFDRSRIVFWGCTEQEGPGKRETSINANREKAKVPVRKWS